MSSDLKSSLLTQSVLIVSSDTDHVAMFRSVFSDGQSRCIVFQDFVAPEFTLPDEGALIILDCQIVTDQIIACLEALQQSRPCAVLVFAEQGDAASAQSTMRAGASACVIDGLQPHRIEALAAIALERFRQSQEIREELQKTRDSIEARKFIERAKGVLMKSRGISEDEAYRLIRSAAMKQSRSMKEVSESILSVADIF